MFKFTTTRRSEVSLSYKRHIASIKESRVERHMTQHDMTTQMEGGARETIGKRVSNHEIRSEGNLQLHDTETS